MFTLEGLEQEGLKLGGPEQTERGSRLGAPEQKLGSRARAVSEEARFETRRCGIVIL